MSYNSRTVVIEVETRYGVCNYSSVDTLWLLKWIALEYIVVFVSWLENYSFMYMGIFTW